MDKHRLDKWLWAARFYKTRALAAEDIAKGRISDNDQVAKASRDLREGDVVELGTYQLVVEEVDGVRITRLRAIPLETASAGADHADD